MSIDVYNFPFDIPKTYYRAIGEVIAKMALVELQVMHVIGRLLKIKDPKQVRVAFMGMGMKARIGAMQALASNWSPTQQIRQELCSIAADARKLSGVRNSFAHGQWGYKQNGDRRKLAVAFAEEGKDFYLPKGKPYKSAELIAKAQEVRAVSKRLKRVIEALDAASP
jgi:hypothetical protein